MKYSKEFLADLKFTSALRKVILFCSLFGIYTALPLLFDNQYRINIQYLSDVETIFGIVIGLILVFRANRAYERWWEARSLWGNLINASRNLALKISCMPGLKSDQVKRTFDLINEFASALQEHLGKQNKKIVYTETLKFNHQPTQVVNQLYCLLKAWQLQKLFLIEDLWLIDRELRELMIITGACEKIKNTWVSASFRVFSRQVIFVFLLMLPWVLVQSTHYFAIPFSIICSYCVFGLEGIASNLEEPFGKTEDHVDMEGLVQVIKKSLNFILEERSLGSD